ncbi:hypothetical protein [Bifidobacterium callitrichidarum]|uniref:Uncharacterized protein n=1 Tax=Bifidobacterium callitrichidarum TaxID=2052941 RepID=A0A2U2NC92_9BIFI|nr:hypothetical protein [Bifidobacterium callitrichidarum]PWG66765.1 hypothetical protein DF196_02360 [Bifidobacterium callitrichidarum]
MNIAYKNYLLEAADDMNLTDMAKTIINGFINQLDKYTDGEPSVDEYAEAANSSIAYQCDRISLIDHSIDPNKLTDDQRDELLATWSGILLDMLCDSDMIDDALDEALDQMGINRDDIADN